MIDYTFSSVLVERRTGASSYTQATATIRGGAVVVHCTDRDYDAANGPLATWAPGTWDRVVIDRGHGAREEFTP